MKPYTGRKAAYVAPLSAPIIMFFVLLVFGDSIIVSAFTSVYVCIISYIGFTVFVLPLHKYLKAKNKENMMALVVSGLIGGSFIVSILYILLGVVLGSREFFALSATAVGAFFGGVVAFVAESGLVVVL